MTPEQETKMIELLESIDRRLALFEQQSFMNIQPIEETYSIKKEKTSYIG